MRVSVYIERWAMDTLRCYGRTDDVVNCMLDAAEEEGFSILDKPSAGPRTFATRVEVIVTNEMYIKLANALPPASPRLSLRRYIHWFLSEDMPSQLGWKVISPYLRHEKEKIARELSTVETSCKNLRNLFDRVGAEAYEEILSAMEDGVKMLRRIK